MGLDWAWIGLGLGLDWAWIGLGLGLDWAWIGLGLGLDWAWIGIGLGLSWAWIGIRDRDGAGNLSGYTSSRRLYKVVPSGDELRRAVDY